MRVFIFFLLLLASMPSLAASAQMESAIGTLSEDGFLSPENAQLARAYYNDEREEKESWTHFLSMVNLLKVLGVGFLLWAFRGVIEKLIRAGWRFIRLIPTIYYQMVLLAFTIFLTVAPAYLVIPANGYIFNSLAGARFYIALFGSLASLLVMVWVFAVYEQFLHFILRRFPPLLRVALIGLDLTLYFALLAFLYQSQIFGFLAVAALVAASGFFVSYSSLGLSLGVKGEDYLLGVVAANLALVAGNFFAPAAGLMLFKVGLNYLPPIALGCSLLIASSPFLRDYKLHIPALFLMIIVGIGSVLAVNYLAAGPSPVILVSFFSFFVLEWLGYGAFKTHWIVGSAVVGVLLWALALLMESYPGYFVGGLF
jgi:hypothetical protein